MLEIVNSALGLFFASIFFLSFLSLLSIIVSLCSLYIRENSEEFYENYDFLEHNEYNSIKSIKGSSVGIIVSSLGMTVVFMDPLYLLFTVVIPFSIPALGQIYSYKLDKLNISGGFE